MAMLSITKKSTKERNAEGKRQRDLQAEKDADENIKYASCSFVTNPFAALLDNDATLGSTFWRRKGS